MFEQFTDHKLPVFPVILVKTGDKLLKKPAIKAWQDSIWFENDGYKADIAKSMAYGVALTEDWVVVDFDSYKIGAPQSLEKLIELGLDINTFTVESARGGNHFYYRNPTKQSIRKTHTDFPGIDFLSTGCFTVGPGTITMDGAYQTLCGSLETALEIPQAVLELLERGEAALSASSEPVDTVTELARYKEIVASEQGVEQGSRGLSAYKLAAKGRDLGLSEQDTFECMLDWNMRCLPPEGYSELRVSVRNAYAYSRNTAGVAATNLEMFSNEEAINVDSERSIMLGWDQDAKGIPKPTLNNLYNIFQCDKMTGFSDNFVGLFKYNEFESVVELTRKPFFRSFRDTSPLILSNMDILKIRDFIARHYRLDYSVDNIMAAIKVDAYAKCYHPIRSWLEGLEWDGTPRLIHLFNDYFRFSSPDPAEIKYRGAVGKAMMLASIWRIFQPGYKWDHCLVLAGATNFGKSIFVETIGGQYSGALPKMSLAESELQKMNGLWWIEYPELSAAKKSDINEIKAFITITSDIYRRPYDRLPERHQRECIMVWTLNPESEGFLKDETGNRRFLIIDVEDMIDIETIKRERDQLFAEAMHLFKQGIEPLTYLLDDEVKAMAKSKQDENLKDFSDPWMDMVQDWFDKKPELLKYKQHRAVTGTMILSEALGIHLAKEIDHRTRLRISRVMRDLGWLHAKSNGKNMFYDPSYNYYEDLYDI
jgi:predicted P-loop ATPase